MSKQSPKDPKFRCNICKEYFYAPEHLVHYQCPKHGYLCDEHIGKKGQLVYGHDEINNPNKSRTNDIDAKQDPYFDIITNMPESLIDKCLCDIDGSFMEKTEFINYSGAVTFDETFINELKGYNLDDFRDDIGEKVVDELNSVGCDSVGGVLEFSTLELKEKTSLNKETIEKAVNKLKELVFKDLLEIEPESSLVLLERNILHRRCSKSPAKFIWNNNIQRWLEVGKETEVDFLKDEVYEKKSNGNSIEIKLLIDLFKKNVLTKEQFLEQLQQKI
jgi:hypothetical protein